MKSKASLVEQWIINHMDRVISALSRSSSSSHLSTSEVEIDRTECNEGTVLCEACLVLALVAGGRTRTRGLISLLHVHFAIWTTARPRIENFICSVFRVQSFKHRRDELAGLKRLGCDLPLKLDQQTLNP